MHWLRELPKDIREEAERTCADVLKRLGYPLLYPGERPEEQSAEGREDDEKMTG